MQVGDRAIAEAIGGLSGTPIVLAAVLVVFMCLGVVVWTTRSFLKYQVARNSKMETALGKLWEQYDEHLRASTEVVSLLKRIAEKLG